ncbi:hypothetical protein EJ08DRAFT_619392 [Tothia fuscella]|uniref:Uncharacterized protein n=1 Tax=Tothia fuscella TaxID=1048955 RepID=A0A9P4NI93_9PEZI|nr:hypothetical protein EJ08DRAFT_619392 [Tothia fuscella]
MNCCKSLLNIRAAPGGYLFKAKKKCYDAHKDSIKSSSPISPFQTPFKGFKVETLQQVWTDMREVERKAGEAINYSAFAVLDERSARDKSILIVRYNRPMLDELRKIDEEEYHQQLEERSEWSYYRVNFRHSAWVAIILHVGSGGWDEWQDGREKYTDKDGIIQVPLWARDRHYFPNLTEDEMVPWGSESESANQ